MKIQISLTRLCQSQAVRHSRDPGSIWHQFMWGLWWLKWHSDRLLCTSVFPRQHQSL